MTFCWCGSTAEQLICNQQVDGSNPFTSSNSGRLQSGQMQRTVNPSSPTSMVRIHLFPPEQKHKLGFRFVFFLLKTQTFIYVWFLLSLPPNASILIYIKISVATPSPSKALPFNKIYDKRVITLVFFYFTLNV